MDLDLNLDLNCSEPARRPAASSSSDSQTGLGAIALAALLGRDGRAADEAHGRLRRRRQPDGAPAAALPGQGQACHLSAHVGRRRPSRTCSTTSPTLVKHNMQPCPDELLKNQRFAFIKGHPKLLGTPYKFRQHGQSGQWISELLPHIGEVVDDIAVIRSMHTDQFNHAPAELFIYTGTPRNGGAAMGSWITYGLGSENEDLPGFVVLISGGTDPTGGKALWSTGFLPTVYQGVQCRTVGDPILYVSDPKGMDRADRRRTLDALRAAQRVRAARSLATPRP